MSDDTYDSVTVTVDLEAREAMYHELCDEFGTDQIDSMIDTAVQSNGENAARRQVMHLYENREQLRENLDE